MDYFPVLLRSGLSKKEAAIYIALLEHGPMTLAAVSHVTHINRPALYATFPELSEKGLVSSVVKGKRRTYIAEPVERVEMLYEEREKNQKAELAAFKEAYAKVPEARPVVKYFEGKKGMHFAFDDVVAVLPRRGVFYRYSARTGPKSEAFSDTTYSRLREKMEIERYVIASEGKAAEKKPKLNRHVRAIPKDFDLFEDNVSLLIYGNKTAYVDYETETTLLIESEKIARFQEKLFKLLWKNLKR